MQVYAWDEVLLIVVIAKLVNMAYLFVTGYDKYWLAVVPFGHLYVKSDLAGVNKILLSLSAILSLLSLYSYDLITSIITLILVIVINVKYSSIYVDDCNPYVYSMVPFAKYIIMCKEVFTYAGDATRRRV